MSVPRIPTRADYESYDGGHCRSLWRRTSEHWRCPGCGRTKFELLRWTERKPQGKRFEGWFAGLAHHHDHGTPARFATVVICDQCNGADGVAKRDLGLPKSFSFSPAEIGQYISPHAHGSHDVDLEKAREIYKRVTGSR